MKRLLTLALLLACIVVPLGAYVRLSDAGLGCPDWPGCYGQPTPLHAAAAIDAAQAARPDGPVSHGKAWKEMLHRYLAATLGLLIVAVALLAWRGRRQRWQAGGLLALVVLQGLLGMWTVTLLLKPAVVSAHLLGGMSIVALLAMWRLQPAQLQPVAGIARIVARCLPLLLLLQIALGAWVSSNYAALACQGFPGCNGAWWPADMQFHGAFHWQRELGESIDGTPLQLSQLTAIHWSHRLGALLLTLLLLWLARRLWVYPTLRPRLAALLAALALQLALGVGNVLWQLPLPLAVAHNAGAMLLLAMAANLALALCSPLRQAQRQGRLRQHDHQGESPC